MDELRAELDRLKLLLICKTEALGVFADPAMWIRLNTPGQPIGTNLTYHWNGDGTYADPQAFAKREADREEPFDTGWPTQR